MSAKPTPDRYRLYEVKLVHRLHDWDATLKYAAPSAKTARSWALGKMANPRDWLIVSAAIAKQEHAALLSPEAVLAIIDKALES